ncbi:triggering receptor expressed on myeloid cells 3-like isoform X2 [Tupaia chinensis]|uniref:triggering receptor expressed on myeloid cells 3-like isoform X2 n=1 Tax=Tupaia chinensis TaxID=246437 RepID=UPI000FFC6FF1|nr:triggering receptor expressed on myeloid cells 3-like isoform X2 [Tupaia chinensis]
MKQKLEVSLEHPEGFQATGENEEEICLQEGKNLTVTCPYNIMKYASSRKAWQRVRSQSAPETLVRTETRNQYLNRAQVGRYLLEDYPTEAVIRVTVTELQRQDLGLYQCVVLLMDPFILHHRIRLIDCKGGREWNIHQTPLLLGSGMSNLGILAFDLADLPLLAVGLILNKGLVFSVLFALLCKHRATDKAAS